MSLPHEAKARKAIPLFSGLLRYFPDALQAVADLSRVGNDQHNPGQPLHWAKEKSTDEQDALMRHLVDAGTRDVDGVRHSAKVAWRALAALQREIEADNGSAGQMVEERDPSVVPCGAGYHYEPIPINGCVRSSIGDRYSEADLVPYDTPFPSDGPF